MEERLYIPANVKEQSEFFDGFGFPELFGTLLITAIVLAIFFVVHLSIDNLPL